jgi:hypothetical protein
MGNTELTVEEARQELIRLIEADEYEITEKAEKEGKQILRRHHETPTSGRSSPLP